MYDLFDLSLISAIKSECLSEKFSAAEIAIANWSGFFLTNSDTSKLTVSPVAKSQLSIISLIIPCNPISLPSSGV